MKWKFFVAALLLIQVVFGKAAFLAWAVSVPTTAVATPAATITTQADYEWYENVDTLTPTVPLASADAASSTPSTGSVVRLRMNVGDASLPVPVGTTFALQYATSTAGPWTDLSTSTAWTFFDNPSVADGQIIVTTVLAASTAGESYGESNPSAASPLALVPGDFGEWDWVVANNSADTSVNWFFRMIYASGTAFTSYTNYPELAAVPPSPPPPPPPPGGGGSPGGPAVQVGSGGGTGYPTTSTSTKNQPVSPLTIPPAFQCLDFTGDGRVDITDFSILLYYYGKPIPPDAPISCLLGLTHHEIVDFTDVSILMYYWTG